MTIGIRRINKDTLSPGPGHYSPERGDGITKQNSRATDFNRSVGRPQSLVDPNNGPGSYTINSGLGTNLNKMTIRERHSENIKSSVGPG